MDLFTAFTPVAVKLPGGHGMGKEEQVASKFIQQVNEQLAILDADMEGKAYAATRTVYVGEAGSRNKQEVSKKLSRWWKKVDGTFYVILKYGNSALTFDGNNAFPVGDKLEGVKQCLEAARASAQSGDKRLLKELVRVSALRGRKGTQDAPTEPQINPAPETRKTARKA